MKIDVYGVKTDKDDRRRYHHGDLRTSLIEAGLKLVEEGGPTAFSLRAAARRAGVSAAAPAHHFRDTRALLTAIATVGFVEFGEALEAVTGPDRRSTIIGHCHAYLRFALERPGLFRLMWRKEALDVTDSEHVAAATRAFAISDNVVRGPTVDRVSPDDPILARTIAFWSMTHGLAMLIIDGAFFARDQRTIERSIVILDSILLLLDKD